MCDICRIVIHLCSDYRKNEGGEFTIVRHGKNGNLGDRTIATLDTTSPLVDCRQISIHVTRVSTTTRHFFTGCRNLSFLSMSEACMPIRIIYVPHAKHLHMKTYL